MLHSRHSLRNGKTLLGWASPHQQQNLSVARKAFQHDGHSGVAKSGCELTEISSSIFTDTTVALTLSGFGSTLCGDAETTPSSFGGSTSTGDGESTSIGDEPSTSTRNEASTTAGEGESSSTVDEESTSTFEESATLCTDV